MKTRHLKIWTFLLICLIGNQSCGQPELGLDAYEALIKKEVFRGDDLPDAIHHIRQIDQGKEGPVSVSPILPYLQYGKADVRKNALRLIRSLKNREDACKSVLDAAKQEGDSFLLLKMIDFLAAMSYREAIPFIKDLLETDKYGHVSLFALQYFTSVKDTTVVPLLLKYTTPEKKLLTIPAIAAMDHNFTEEAAIRLKEIIYSEEFQRKYKFKALYVLGKHNAPQYCSFLTSLLSPHEKTLLIEFTQNAQSCDFQGIEEYFIDRYDAAAQEMQQREIGYILHQIQSKKYFQRLLEDYLADSGNREKKRMLLRFYQEHFQETLENVRYSIDPELQKQILTKVRSGLTERDWISWEVPFEDIASIKIFEQTVWVEAEMVKDEGTMKHYNFLMLLDENQRIEYSELISGGMGCGIFKVPNR